VSVMRDEDEAAEVDNVDDVGATVFGAAESSMDCWMVGVGVGVGVMDVD